MVAALTAATSIACGRSESPTAPELQPRAPSIPIVILRADSTAQPSFSVPLSTVSFTPTVIVYDQYSQPMPGVPVTFSAHGVGLANDSVGSCNGAVRSVVLTDASGRARCSAWTVGSVEGSYFLYADAPNVSDWASRKNPPVIHTLFGMPVLRPDPPGVVFDLVGRTGYQLLHDAGHLVLANDGTYKLVYLGIGDVPDVEVSYGVLVQESAFVCSVGGGTFLVNGDHATLSYSFIADDEVTPPVIAHVVEDYTRRR
jgi:hypothetical protein